MATWKSSGRRLTRNWGPLGGERRRADILKQAAAPDDGCASVRDHVEGRSRNLAARLIGHHRATVREARQEVAVAFALFLGSAGLAVVSGRTLAPGVLEASPGAASTDLPEILLGILATNLGAAFLMFAGLVTFGVAALAMAAAAGMFFGHSIAIAVAELGVVEVIARAVLYTPLEVYGLTLAVASGLTSVTDVLFRDDRSVRDALRRARHRSLGLIAHAVLVLILAALVEVLSIAVWSI